MKVDTTSLFVLRWMTRRTGTEDVGCWLLEILREILQDAKVSKMMMRVVTHTDEADADLVSV